MTPKEQICPVSDCRWINPIVEWDEDTVFRAAEVTAKHLLVDHPGLTLDTWREVMLIRLELDEVIEFANAVA